MHRASLVAVLVAVAGVGGYAVNVAASTGSGLTTTILAKSTYGSLNISAHSNPANAWGAKIKTRGLSDLYVVDNKFAPKTTTAPGGTTGWHSHPGPSLIQVISGSVTDYTGDDPTCTGRTYGAGEGFVDPGGDDVHMLRNEGIVPAETIAVQLLPKDALRRVDEPEPGNCHV